MILPAAAWRDRDGLDALTKVLGAADGESRFVGRGTVDDITHTDGRRMLGFEPFKYASFVNEGERKAITAANEILGF